MDRRWQLVLDCLDTEQAPFGKGTLVVFRQRLIEAHMDRRLIERTIEIANQNQAFGSRALRAALDSSPLWGAGRIEDTCNLLGHALKKVMRVVADQQGKELAEVASEAGAVCGQTMLIEGGEPASEKRLFELFADGVHDLEVSESWLVGSFLGMADALLRGRKTFPTKMPDYKDR